MVNGYQAFRDTLLTPSSPAIDRIRYGLLSERMMRYNLLWAAYHNDLYDPMIMRGGYYDSGTSYGSYGRRGTHDVKRRFGLGKDCFGVFNLAYRIAEIHAQTLLGGSLDPDAGDGKGVSSAIPIKISDSSRAPILRPALAKLFLWSNLEAEKDTICRYGAITGDAPILISDQPDRFKVTLVPFDPAELEDKTIDTEGNTTSFVRVRRVEDPTIEPPKIGWLHVGRKTCKRTEQYVKQDDGIHLCSFRDDSPFVWEDLIGIGTDVGEAEWLLPYDFCPLVHIQHINLGLDWGLSEYSVGIAKGVRADDGGSAALMQGRKAVEAILAIPGADSRSLQTIIDQIRGDSDIPLAPSINGNRAIRHREPTDTVPVIGVPEGSIPTYVAPSLDVNAFSSHVDKVVKSHIDDYPEVSFEAIRQGANASGETLREARKPAERKMRARRVAYRNGMVRALKMGLTIGGVRGYDGFAGITLDSFDRNELDFTIGDTPIYEVTQSEKVQEMFVTGQAIKSLTDGGIPFEIACRMVGLDDQVISDSLRLQYNKTLRDYRQQP